MKVASIVEMLLKVGNATDKDVHQFVEMGWFMEMKYVMMETQFLEMDVQMTAFKLKKALRVFQKFLAKMILKSV